MLMKDLFVGEKIWGPNIKARRIFFFFQKAGLFLTNITTAATRSASDVNGGYGLALCRDERNIIIHSNTTVRFKTAEDFCKLRTGSYRITFTIHLIVISLRNSSLWSPKNFEEFQNVDFSKMIKSRKIRGGGLWTGIKRFNLTHFQFNNQPFIPTHKFFMTKNTFHPNVIG